MKDALLRPCRTLMLAGLLFALILATFARGDDQDQGTWLDAITSNDEVERQAAARSATAERMKVIQELIAIVTSPVTEGEPFYFSTTPRNVAIRMLGELRAKEAVPALLGHLLKPKDGYSFAVTGETMFSPPGKALIEIGLPSVPPLLDVLREKGCSSPEMQTAITEGSSVRYEPKHLKRSSYLGDACLRIIVAILGGQHTKLLLETAVSEAATPEEKENLESALALLDSPQIPDRLKKRGLMAYPW